MNMITDRANSILSTNNDILLYHGSKNIVDKPVYGKGKPDNDYGRGFYLTLNKNLACEWAALYGYNNSCYLNTYMLNMSGLKILELDSRNTIEWISILYANRGPGQDVVVTADYHNWLISNVRKDINEYDCITGMRADDSYYRFVNIFVSGTFTDRQVNRMLNAGNLGKQFVLMSKEAFSRIKFIGSDELDFKYWKRLAEKRDRIARDTLFEVQRDSYSIKNGKTIRDYVYNK